MKNSKLKYSLILFLITITLSCKEKKSKFHQINVPDMNLALNFKHLGQEIFEADTSQLEILNKKWISDYGILYESFVYQMLNSGSVHDPMVTLRLKKFIADSTMQEIYKSITTEFGDLAKEKEEIVEAFKRYCHFFDKSFVPKVVFFYSNFNAKIFPTDSILGVGLDMFLGENNEVIQALPTEMFPAFYKKKMDEKYLVSDVMKYWVYSQFEKEKFPEQSIYFTQGDLLNTFVEHGKMMFILKALLPEKTDANLINYTQEQIEWCRTNEYQMWQFLVEENLVYNKNQKEISLFINDGPFTARLPESVKKESPPQVGVWIGWQIVQQYMEKNPDLNLQDLLKEKNARNILKFYKPN